MVIMAVRKLLRKEAVTNEATVFKSGRPKIVNSMVKGVPKQITFRVYKDEDGVLCASTKDEKIYTFGKTLNKLWDNIRDIVETYYEVPYTEITIYLKFEAQGNDSAETVTC
jgi:predicted RNase H-like HicB family nuclease